MASIVVNPNGLNNTDNNSPSYFDISVTGAGNAPRPILDGQYDGFCLSPFDPIDGNTYPAEVADGADLSAYTNAAADLSGVDADDVAAVNYLLFQYYVDSSFPFSDVEPGVIQFAIWQELDFFETETSAENFLAQGFNWNLLTNGLANNDTNRTAFLAEVAAVRGEIDAARSGSGLDVPPEFQTALIDPTENPANAPDLQPLIVVLSGLGDRVWSDDNANGQQDPGEDGVAGVVVELKDAAGDVVADTVTDANGDYSFTGLPPGTYSVVFTPPAGFLFTDLNVGDDTLDSDADPAMGGMTQAVTLASGEFNSTLDAGLVQTASLGDKVFFDTDGDGIQDAGEGGVADVTVTLTGGGANGVIGDGDDTTEVTTTDANGEYLFEDLNPGEEYKVTFSDLPVGFQFTAADQGGDDALDSDADPANGMTQVVTLAPGEFNDTLDAGIVEIPPEPGSITGRYFCDENNNDVDDGQAVDPGIAGVMVTLFDAAGAAVADTMTGPEGEYSFAGVAPGTYSVQFTDPNNVLGDKELVDPNVGGDDTIDSDAIGDTDLSTIGGIVVQPGQENADNDAGAEKLGSLSGRYFCDENDNDVDDGQAVDPGVEGVLVTLFDAAGNEVGTTTTDGEGLYSFGDLRPGDYSVQFTDPTGVLDDKQLVNPNVGGDDTIDSDAIGDTTLSTIANITVVGGENTPDNDAGAEKVPGSISGRYFCDENNNDVDDGQAVDPGIAGVMVTLFDAAGAAVADTMTGPEGEYSFAGVAPGTYSVQFTDPTGVLADKELVDPNVGGDDTIDSDAIGDTTTSTIGGIVVQPGQENADNDAGAEKLGSLSGRYFCDENDNDVDDGQAVDPGVEGVLVTLFDAAGNEVGTTTTDGEGLYSFGDLRPGDYSVQFTDPTGVLDDKQLVNPNVGGDDTIDSDAIGDTTLSTIANITVVGGENTPDNDAGAEKVPGSISGRYFCDENNNDVDDGQAIDPGVEGVVVTLLDENGDPTGLTTVTDAVGEYSFDDLAPGTYSVQFTDPTGVLADKELVDPNVGGDDTIDSDAIGDTTTSTIGGIVVEAGQENADNDAGAEKLGSLSGRYFCDENDNDVDDGQAIDPGVEGVLVTLFDAAGNEVGTTTTDGEGLYSFGDLRPGDYSVQFTDPTGVLDDKQLVNPNVGGDDTIDSDAIGDTTLSTIANITVVGGENTPDNDAGAEKVPGSISGRYFCDENNNDVDDGQAVDPGIAGVMVTLFDAAGAAVADTMTGPEGEYSFTGVAPGTYSVQFTDPNNVLGDKELVDPNVGGDDTIDSDAIGDTDLSTIGGIVVQPGQENADNDAGAEKLGSLSGRYFCDENDNDVDDGQAIDPGVAGVLVTLLDAAGNAVASTTTDAQGNYLFENLRAGDYIVQFPAEPDKVFVAPDAGNDDTVDSDVTDPAQGRTDIVSVGPGEDVENVDAGVVKPGIDIETCIEVTESTQGEEIHLDFEGFARGTKITDQYAGQGVTISASGGSGDAMVFDSANPTGGDGDLATSNQGNVLIISEDGDSSDPDDNVGGGTLFFDFSDPDGVAIDEISLLDTEEGGEIRLFDTEGALVDTIPIPSIADGAQQTVPIGAVGLGRMEVHLDGSGAITGLKYSNTDVSTICDDADVCDDAPEFAVGEAVVIKYEVTNTTGVDLKDVVVVDDNRTPGDTTDDFEPVFVGGDDDGDGILDQGETWIYESSSQAVEGVNTANATVTGTATNDDGSGPIQVSDVDAHCYTGIDFRPGIDIEKFVNGIDVTDPDDLPEIGAGADVTFTYEVTNTGNVAFSKAEVIVGDDAGTPGDSSDDFTPTLVASSDVGGDGILSAGETWLYESETVSAENLTTTTEKEAKLVFTGSDRTTGHLGNVKTFSADGLSVEVSGFSRDDSGNWAKGYVGAYGGGLGVTNLDEGGSGHRVDNGTKVDYLLFEFDKDVVVDRAFLASVGADSDISIWIGDRDGADISHLSDSLLDDYFNERNMANHGSSRWADINSDEVSGDTVIISAYVNGSNDEFKLKNLEAEFLEGVGNGEYRNVVTVSAGGVSDSDVSGYVNPEPVDLQPGIDIEKFVNGIDVTDPDDLPEIAAGADVTFTYEVTNTGNVAFSKAEVIVDDDAGTPGDSSDDFAPTLVASSDDGGDGILSAGETWLYESETVSAENLTTTTEKETKLVFTGSDRTTGHLGNVKTFSADGLSVEVSGFSRDDSGNWAKGYVGAYGGGLGVTNLDEGGSGHRVDNGTKVDYLLFEFDKDVVVDRAFLASVGADSDISIWIGDRDGADISHLSDSLLDDYFNERNMANHGSSRWADINSDEVSGDTVIISAYVNGSNDEFKLKNLEAEFLQNVGGDEYRNTVTVSAGGVSDSDISGFVNPATDDEVIPSIAVCEEFGKAQAIEFNYAPSSNVNTSQDSDKADIRFDSGLVDDDGVSFIVVSEEDDPHKLELNEGENYFEGNVGIGDDFIAMASNLGDDKFGSKTFIHIFDDNPFDDVDDGDGSGLLQSMEYHTSCSQPIILGDEVGGVTLVGYQGEDGSWGI